MQWNRTFRKPESKSTYNFSYDTHTQKYCPEHSFILQYYHAMKSTSSVYTSLITEDDTEYNLKKNKNSKALKRVLVVSSRTSINTKHYLAKL